MVSNGPFYCYWCVRAHDCNVKPVSCIHYLTPNLLWGFAIYFADFPK